MTVRDVLNRQKRLVMAVMYFGAGLFALSFAAWQGFGLPGDVMICGVVGFAIAWLTMAGAYVFGIRCPCCRNRLTHLVLADQGFHLNPFRLNPRIRFCPFCGADMDTECGNSDPS